MLSRLYFVQYTYIIMAIGHLQEENTQNTNTKIL